MQNELLKKGKKRITENARSMKAYKETYGGCVVLGLEGQINEHFKPFNGYKSTRLPKRTK